MGIFLGLGSNVGDREKYLRAAIALLMERDIVVQRSASVYRTEPRDFEAQPWFLNTVIDVQTSLEPEQLMRQCLDVEKTAGRLRNVFKGPRSLDVDLLLYEDRVLNRPGLTIPHMRFRERRFVLVPLVELAPELRDPVSGLTMLQLLDVCQDKGRVEFYRDPLLRS